MKVVYDKKKASSNPERVEKKAKIYGISRRDPALSAKLSSSFKDDAWTGEGEVWDGLGLGKWDYAKATELAKCATGRLFKNYIEEAHDGVISNHEAEHGATLVAKYKGLRFYDEDAGEGTYYRIRADLFSWAGKKRGGWLATCDEMPSGGPSKDPVEDIERSDEYDPEAYIIDHRGRSGTWRGHGGAA